MIDKDPAEVSALEYAGQQAGEYLEYAIEKGWTTDLSNWPGEAYDEFIEAIVTSYNERFTEEKVPF